MTLQHVYFIQLKKPTFIFSHASELYAMANWPCVGLFCLSQVRVLTKWLSTQTTDSEFDVTYLGKFRWEASEVDNNSIFDQSKLFQLRAVLLKICTYLP